MNKAYLLLRNNKPSGPYSFEELVQTRLKPFELIWIEGKSAGWRYPSEIEVLKPYVSEIPLPEIQRGAESLMTFEQPHVFQPLNHIDEVIPIRATVKSSAKNIFVSLPAGSQQGAKPLQPDYSNNTENKPAEILQ